MLAKAMTKLRQMRQSAHPSVVQTTLVPLLPCQALHELHPPISEAEIMQRLHTVRKLCATHQLLANVASLHSHDISVASTPTTQTIQRSLWDKAEPVWQSTA